MHSGEQKTKIEIEELIQAFKRDNFKLLGPFAFGIFVLMSLADISLSEKGLLFFVLVRSLFALPTLVLSQLTNTIKLKNVEFAIFCSFIFVGIGISFISYTLGGLTSDYYFGLIIISFVQYAFTPLNRGMTILLDMLFFLLFFPLNILPFEVPPDEISKQVANFFSFVLLKFVVAGRSHKQISDALKTAGLEKEVESQRYIQQILGELCHLFNNPLFISMSMLKNITKKNTITNEDRPRLQKAFEANERMNGVLKKMLEITAKKEDRVDLDALRK